MSRIALRLPLAITCTLLLFVGGWPSQTVAQEPDTPRLLAPVDDYRGVGTPSEGGLELQQFHSSEFDAGNLAWIMIGSMASLFLITPGLLLFYWLR
ncbi:MAG TPA: hypothetical protein QF564_24740 [Pirellulaceae bacterium]|nr:hypothetical protein [Pirellulaceae bacterium]